MRNAIEGDEIRASHPFVDRGFNSHSNNAGPPIGIRNTMVKLKRFLVILIDYGENTFGMRKRIRLSRQEGN